jgi:Holliday junction resolvase-like predicted endonuclease
MSESTTSKSRLGDLAEFYAVTWLWDQGYEVFLNPGSSGAIDMIACKDGEIILIDVKTESKDKRCLSSTRVSRGRSQEQVKLGVVILGFNPKTRKFRWVEHKE